MREVGAYAPTMNVGTAATTLARGRTTCVCVRRIGICDTRRSYLKLPGHASVAERGHDVSGPHFGRFALDADGRRELVEVLGGDAALPGGVLLHALCDRHHLVVGRLVAGLL